MLCRRIALTAAKLPKRPTTVASPPPHPLRSAPFSSLRSLRASPPSDSETFMPDDYINPTDYPHPVKRQFRDPYYPWDDVQERRNFGEPVHEDNDLMGMLSLTEYTHKSPGHAGLCWLAFISCLLGLSYVVKQTYPDRPTVPREYPDGLERELGGPHALRAFKEGDEM